MPFGVTSALALFMDYMNKIFKPFLDKFVLVFIDDILTYSKTHADHVEHLRTLLGISRKEKLYVNCQSVSFGCKRFNF